MKILELRFQNLNSLYGEWLIDFTDPEYAGNGIFALTGSTGAGKSTVLDAICLALYGSTPRLGRITQSENEIMSRRTGECYAEVLFESRAGRFRCHWEQRRARKKLSGKFQHPEHQMIDDATGRPIETKKRQVAGEVEEKTGMNFDRFTRSILLAQGGFDTFLKANTEEKSKILEQITGTGIYTDISKLVHERQRDEREKLNLRVAELSGIEILEPEEEEKLRLELAEKLTREAALAAQSAALNDAVKHLNALAELKRELALLAESSVKLQEEAEAFQSEREKLELALKAAQLDGLYATLTGARKRQTEDRTALAAVTKSLPELIAGVETQAVVLKGAEEQQRKAGEELKSGAFLIRSVRALDQRLGEQEKALQETEQASRSEAAKIEAGRQLRSKEEKKRLEAEKSLAALNAYLIDHVQDKELLSSLGGLEEQKNSLLAARQELERDRKLADEAQTAQAQTQKKLDDSLKQCAERKRKLAVSTETLQAARKELAALLAGRLLREYRAEKETLLREMAFLARISELEALRPALEDGKPCPLCGAKEHPYAMGNVPASGETEKKIDALSLLIGKAEAQEAAILKLEKTEREAQKNLSDSEKSEAAAAIEAQTAEKTLGGCKSRLAEVQARFEQRKRTLLARLQPFGISEAEDIASLKVRLEQWEKAVAGKEAGEKEIAGFDIEITRLDGSLSTRNHALEEVKKLLAARREALSATRTERQKLYGGKDPDQEELRLNAAVAAAGEAGKAAAARHLEMRRKLDAARTNAEALTQRLELAAVELDAHERELAARLILLGFADEAEFRDAVLPQAERAALAARAKLLEDRLLELQANRKDRETRLAAELARKLTDQTLEELLAQSRALEESLKQQREAVAGLKIQLQRNEEEQQRIREKQTSVAAQRSECRRWDRLHELIGSADGKKYRNFAQGLTFDIMISHANLQLEKMTDRYLLERDAQQPLELNVIDNYQAGEVRSTKNLSGGESFIVSLTLALGLSQMAGRRDRVDSLFLDEGFGTLDEETLETALEALAGLRHEGKLIGVISHISALKERIATQITVSAVSGGRSTISGPGCRQI